MNGRAAARLTAAAEEFAFPRRAGSAGSERVVELVADRLQKIGFGVAVERFGYDLEPVARALRWALVAAAVVVVAAGWAVRSSPMIALLLMAAAVAAGGLLLGWSPRLERLYRRDGPTRTANVVGRRGVTEPRRRVVLMAHHDSKSQSLALPARMAATVATAAGAGAVVVAAIVELVHGRLGAAVVGPVGGALAGVGLLALAMMKSGNDSPGGVDNAGSLAIVLEVAARIGPPPDGCELVVLLTGAEEDHMVGAMRWLERHGDELDPRSTACLNFDGAGSPGQTVLITRFGAGRRFAPSLERTAVAAARELGEPVRRIVMAPAVGIDAIPFAHRGIECLTVSSGSLGRATAAVHSSRDVAANLDGPTMARIADFATEVARRTLAGTR